MFYNLTRLTISHLKAQNAVKTFSFVFHASRELPFELEERDEEKRCNSVLSF